MEELEGVSNKMLDNLGRSLFVAMMREVYDWTVSKEWEPDPNRTFGDEVALMHSELSEALEAFRDNKFGMWYTYKPTANGVKLPKMTAEQCEALGIPISGLQPIREGVGPEIGGLLIRILHYANIHGFNPYIEFRSEMDYNQTREIRHGGRTL